MATTYIMVDVEASGDTPGQYSMLSLGACVIGEPIRTFYSELKPISDKFILSAMKIGCLHLEANKGNPASSRRFDPALALRNLARDGVDPATAMDAFHEWVQSVAGNTKAKFVSDTPIFDGMFVYWYFGNFGTRGNPFSGGGLSMNCFCKGKTGNLRASLKHTAGFMQRGPAHHAMHDAQAQAALARKVWPAKKEK